jgi:hypothetical protein
MTAYPGSVKSFSTKVDGGTIFASHVDDLQNEVMAVETALGAPPIDGLTNKAVPVDADELAMHDSISGLLNKLTWANLKAALFNGANKTTPVDADKLTLWDSVGGAMNSLTWANLKATLNALYSPLSQNNGWVAVSGSWS